MIHILYALPNSFLPRPGRKLLIVGIEPSQAREMLKKSSFKSYIKYEDFSKKLTKILGIDIQPSSELSPSPYSDISAEFLLCTLVPVTNEVNFYLIIDGVYQN